MANVENTFLPVPSPAQLLWHRTEVNLFIHFGINTFTGREWGDGTEDPKLFNPTQLDCHQWAQTAKAAGIEIAILTAKHHDGFCLWPSRYTDHTVASSPWKNGKGDVVREFVEAFRAVGLKVGLYLSPWDRHEPSYGDSPRYNDFYCGQLTELLTQYGPLHEVWFDGACAEGPNGKKQEYDWKRIFALVRQYQPQAVTFGDGGTDVRWVGNERGIAAETCWATVDPRRVLFPGDSGICEANDARANAECVRHLQEGEAPSPHEPRAWRPAECDVSIRPGWFYHASEDTQVKSGSELFELYLHSVGRNAVLLLNTPATPAGHLHPNDCTQLRDFRNRLGRAFSENLVEDNSTVPMDEAMESSGTWIVPLRSGAVVGLISLQEDIRFGQRIQSYTIDWQNEQGNWVELVRGSTVGAKKIDRVRPVKARQLRIKFQSIQTPRMERIAAYSPL